MYELYVFDINGSLIFSQKCANRNHAIKIFDIFQTENKRKRTPYYGDLCKLHGNGIVKEEILRPSFTGKKKEKLNDFLREFLSPKGCAATA